jgi:hypothetical protein
MESDYPPLPRSAAPRSSSQRFSLRDASSERGESPGHHPGGRDPSNDQSAAKVLSRKGDVVVVYADRGDPGASHRWRVASGDLMRNSPYFRVLLDPNKFSEGRNIMEQKMSRFQMSGQAAPSDENNSGMLPSISLPVDHFTRRLGIDAIELFLRILCFNSLSHKEKKEFEGELRFLPPPLVARLVEIADVFNSPHAVRDTLKRSGYAFGKGRAVLSKFDASLLRMSEDRIRQIIFIADFLNEHSVFQALTHALIIAGSKFWINGVELPAPDTLRWRYFSGGLEGMSFDAALSSDTNPARGIILQTPVRHEHDHRPPGILPPRIRRTRGVRRPETNAFESSISPYNISQTAPIPMPDGLWKLQRLRRVPPRPNDALLHPAHENSLPRLQPTRSRLQP